MNKNLAPSDEQDTTDDEVEDEELNISTCLNTWRNSLKPITLDDIENYKKNYINSELERTDIEKFYLEGKGCLKHLRDNVPFMEIGDEPRLRKIIADMIAAGGVPKYELFPKEPAVKRKMPPKAGRMKKAKH